MPSKSKIKGNTFERELAKYLSNTYNENFNRIQNSGSYIGGSNNFRKNNLTENQIKSHKGDIVPPDDWKYFNCEAKSYSEFAFHHLLMEKKIPLLEDWINQIMEVADNDDVNIIFMKFNRIGKYICYQLPKPFIANRYVDYTSEKYGIWRFMGFDDFFSLNTELFSKECKKVLDK
jgi:hypothetical protein